MSVHDETMSDLVLMIEQDRKIFFELVDDYETKLRRSEDEIAQLRRQLAELQEASTPPKPGRCATLCRGLSAMFGGSAGR